MSVPRGQPLFGALLREHRLAAALTQEALAERSGVGLRTIQEVEAGSVRPRRTTAQNLIQALNLPAPDRQELERLVSPVPRRTLATGSGDVPPRRDGLVLVPTAPGPAAEPGPEHGLVALPRPARTNVPWPVSNLLGREGDLAAIRELITVGRQRLVTLTGVGGAGKTRLAIQVAADLLSAFVDGVWFVELASTLSPALVPRIVADVLGGHEIQDAPVLDTLLGFLQRKRLLLVLDNCEHLVDTCAELAVRLLTACPELVVLATSREPLQIAGERRWRVQPLAIPERGGAAPLDVLAGTASVRLFVERVQAIEADFSLTETNAVAVAQICARLDGIPLALELAAARASVLSVEQIAERLDDSFRVLSAGSRVGPTRQRTMEATLDWSYNLLTPSEQTMFRTLSAFAGGFDLDAAQQVCSGQSAVGMDDAATCTPLPTDVLDLLGNLVDKSLVVAEQLPDGRRYRLLEPVRQYAQRLLQARGEDQRTYQRHAAYFSALAERAAPKLGGPKQIAWLKTLARDQDNMRSALLWAKRRGELETVARLTVALVPFWEVHGGLREGGRWLDTVLSTTSPLPVALRTRALIGAGRLAFWRVDLDNAAAQFAESLALARELDDQPAVAAAVTWLGAARGAQGAFAEADTLLEEGIARYETLDDEAGTALAQFNLARARGNRGAATGNPEDFARAISLLEASLRRYHALRDVRYGAIAATYLGVGLLRIGERERAIDLLREGLTGLRQFGDHAYLFPSVITLALVAALTEQPVRAARLLGGAEVVAQVFGTTVAPVSRITETEILAAIRLHLDHLELDTARNEGRTMSLDAVMAEAWAVADDAVVPRTRRSR